MKVDILKYINRNTCLAITIFFTLAISIQQISLPPKTYGDGKYVVSQYNNYIIFKNSFFHLIGQKDLYKEYPSEQWDYYKYSPTFALLFAPMAITPDWMGLSAWNLLNALLFFFALWQFPFPDHKKKLLAFAFTFIELTTNLHNEQSNGLIAGLLLFSFLLFECNKFFIGTLLIALSAYVKLFGIAAFILILLYPERRRAILYSAFWMVVLAVLPLLVVPFHQLVFLYQSWLGLLANDHESSYGLSVIGWLHSWFRWDANKIVVTLIGATLLFLPLLKIKSYEKKPFRILMLSSVLIWVIIFNHKAESPTFIIAVAGIAVWFFTKKALSTIDKLLLVFCFVFTILSPTDVFPVYLRNNFIVPYSLKAFPCILIWIKILIEQFKPGTIESAERFGA